MPGKSLQRIHFAILEYSWYFLSGGSQPHTIPEDSKLSSYTLLPCCQQSWLCLADRFPLALRVPRKTQAMLWILPFRDARIGSQLSESDPWATDFLDISWIFLAFLDIPCFSTVSTWSVHVSTIRFVIRLVVTCGNSGVAVSGGAGVPVGAGRASLFAAKSTAATST